MKIDRMAIKQKVSCTLAEASDAIRWCLIVPEIMMVLIRSETFHPQQLLIRVRFPASHWSESRTALGKSNPRNNISRLPAVFHGATSDIVVTCSTNSHESLPSLTGATSIFRNLSPNGCSSPNQTVSSAHHHSHCITRYIPWPSNILWRTASRLSSTNGYYRTVPACGNS